MNLYAVTDLPDRGQADAMLEAVGKISPDWAQMLAAMLENLRSAQPLAVLPADLELTTEEAAQLLDVPQAYFLELLENNPIQVVNGACRLPARDLPVYQEMVTQARQKALDELIGFSQEFNLY